MKKQGKLRFYEKSHKYKIGKKELTPVSTVLKTYFGSVDSKELARKVNKIPPSKYYKMGIRKILAKWKKIAEDGTFIHKEMEDYITETAGFTHLKSGQGIQWLNMQDLDDCHLLPELMVYNEELGIAGTIDLFILDESTMEVTLVDWKTNEKISDQQYQKMQHKVGTIKNTTLQKYYAQLNIYAYLLNLSGYDIKSMKLVQLTGTNEAPNIYEFKFNKENAKYMCEHYEDK